SDAEIVVSVTVTQSVVYVTTHAVTGRGKIQVSGLEPRINILQQPEPDKLTFKKLRFHPLFSS
ncbi:TPA: hypothetical protein ACHKJI_005188, partial [Escherichia coli]